MGVTGRHTLLIFIWVTGNASSKHNFSYSNFSKKLS
uniref:Uncharacterized protein n=2 Tax=unclassified Caudoviricetes TaxID=2788787 RepID=A0A8S5QLD2_9CAUD|nr:MAG TPA: hypothetical protein [Siphoviridae sp. ctVii20]DAE19388.1 MAG TPA: hypothetical protein [Siphoviridae sp. ctezl47]